MEDLLTAKEAMGVLRCSRTFLSDHKAELGATYVGSQLRFPRAELVAYLTSRQLSSPARTIASRSTPKRAPMHKFPSGINPVTKMPYGAHVKGRAS